MTLYVSDLDGTLLDNTAKISTMSKDILNKALQNKINFTIATARTPATVVNILKDINITIPIITMNGSSIYDIKKDSYLYYSTINKNLTLKIKNLLLKKGLNAFAYCMKNNHIFVYHNKLTNPYEIKFYQERKATPYKTFIESPLPDDSEVLYFTMMNEEEVVNSIFEDIKNIKGLSILKYRDTYNTNLLNLEIYSESTSKANAINYLKNYFHFNKLICFGDNLNDIPMFNLADECYAVDNACDELKEIATGVIDSNEQDAVAKFIYNQI